MIDIEGSMSHTEGKGTCTYMEPRVSYNKPNDKHSDFFSYCMMASEVLTGKELPRLELIDLFKMDQSGKNPRPPFPESLPDDLKYRLLSGFEEELSKRSTWQDLIDSFKKYL